MAHTNFTHWNSRIQLLKMAIALPIPPVGKKLKRNIILDVRLADHLRGSHICSGQRQKQFAKSHMDPNKPLVPGNIIPQCQKCNRGDRNRWVYDDKGRVIKVANPNVINFCDLDVQKS